MSDADRTGVPDAAGRRGRHRHAAEDDDLDTATIPPAPDGSTAGKHGRHTDAEPSYPTAADIPQHWGSRVDESRFVPPWKQESGAAAAWRPATSPPSPPPPPPPRGSDPYPAYGSNGSQTALEHTQRFAPIADRVVSPDDGDEPFDPNYQEIPSDVARAAEDAWAGAQPDAVIAPDGGTDHALDVAPTVEEPKFRFGRNLPVAIGVALLLATIVLGTLLIYRPSFVVVISVAMAYGCYELVRAMSVSHPASTPAALLIGDGAGPPHAFDGATAGDAKAADADRAPLEHQPTGDSDGGTQAQPRRHIPLTPLLVGGVAMQLAAWQRGANGLAMALLITVAALIVWRLADGLLDYRRDLSESVFVLLYVPMLAGFAVLLTRPDDGVARVITFIAIVVCSDTGGYAAGVMFGKRLMAPIVSKGKTWEGFAGSLIACSLCGALIMSLTFHNPWWQGVLLGLALAITATLGDLGESLIKRDLGLKDMGNLLPGHGGLMDRLDSLLPCAAVAYLVLAGFVGT